MGIEGAAHIATGRLPTLQELDIVWVVTVVHQFLSTCCFNLTVGHQLSSTCCFNHKQLDACHIPFCSDNKLGAAGAEELVKGDWPELRILTIWWGWRPMLLCIQLCTTWMARHEVIF